MSKIFEAYANGQEIVSNTPFSSGKPVIYTATNDQDTHPWTADDGECFTNAEVVVKGLDVSTVHGIVGITVRDYTIERRAWNNGVAVWLPCWMRDPESTDRAVPSNTPAVFSDVTEAEERLNKFRDDSPHGVYRMTRAVTIVEVVHA